MSSLSIFPPEILECITSMLIMSQQTRLWQCGDSILNIKLKNGGLKRTLLCWSGASWMPWPRWYFRTLGGIQEVEWCMGIGTSLCPTLELNLLPKTLKRLHLACEDVFILLSQQNVNMNDMLPLLHSLHLSGDRLCEKNLKNLPSHLMELCVESPQVSIESSNLFGGLPRSVERLTLSFEMVDQSEYENDLPSGLVSLTLTEDLYADFNWFGKLPKSLKYLEMGEVYFHPDWLTLPPLEVLKLWNCPKSALPQLPQSLKSLELTFIDDCDFESPDEFAPLLPKNLTELKLSDPMSVPSSELKKLPVNLTNFKADISTDRPDIISLFHPQTRIIQLYHGPCSQSLNSLPFPTKLESLSIWHINDDICAMLPTGLQSLRIDQGFMTSKGASKLPKSLTSFAAPFQVFDNTETIKCLAFVKILDLWAKKMPNDFGMSNDFEDWMLSLLPSIPTTGLGMPSLLPSIPTTGLGMPSVLPPIPTTGLGMPSLLPPIPTSNQHNDSTRLAHAHGDNDHLTSLHVHGGKITNPSPHEKATPSPYLTKSFFMSLSKFKSLVKLEIVYSGGTPSDWLCLIPQQVTELNIDSLITFPTANQLSSLPKGLIILRLTVLGPRCDRNDGDLLGPSPRCDWKDEDLLSLPRSLQKFFIDGTFPNLTCRMYEYLPPNLKDSELRCGSEGFISPLDRLYSLQ